MKKFSKRKPRIIVVEFDVIDDGADYKRTREAEPAHLPSEGEPMPSLCLYTVNSRAK